jgi:hypothetical protein
MIGMIYHTWDIISYLSIIVNRTFISWLVNYLSGVTEPECISPKARYLIVPGLDETEVTGSSMVMQNGISRKSGRVSSGGAGVTIDRFSLTLLS